MILVACLFFLGFLNILIPNFIATTKLQAEFVSENVYRNNSDSTNTALIITHKQDEYEYLTSLWIINNSESKYKLSNFNQGVFLKDSNWGSNIQIDKTYQASKLLKESKATYIKKLSEVLGLKIDKYIFIDDRFITSSLTMLDGVKVYNDYENDVFPKGLVDIDAAKYLIIPLAKYDNDGKKLLMQNNFLKGYLSKLSGIYGLINARALNESANKYVNTNFNQKDYQNFISNLILSNQEVEYRFFPSNIFEVVDGIKYVNIERMDEYINSVFNIKAIRSEHAIVEVLNASGTKGMASKFSRFISNAGAQVSRSGNFTFEIEKNTIYVKDKVQFESTLNYIKDLINEPMEIRETGIEKLTTADILVILKDF